MSEEIDYKAEYEKLKQEMENNNFEDIKNKYEEVIAEKNDKINELEEANKSINAKNDEIKNNLTDELNTKLKQAEEITKLNKQVDELITIQAHALVDSYVAEGKVLPAQKEIAYDLAKNDTDKFKELFDNVKPHIEPKERKSHPASDKVEAIANYFKKQ